MNMSARLDKLERTDSNDCVFIWQNNGETGRFIHLIVEAGQRGDEGPGRRPLVPGASK